MKWSEIVKLSKSSGISKSTIKRRVDCGLTGDDLTKPPKAGNYKITEKEAKAIWKDVLRLSKKYKPKEVNICQMVANKHGVTKALVQNMKCGMTWNQVTGLEKLRYN